LKDIAGVKNRYIVCNSDSENEEYVILHRDPFATAWDQIQQPDAP
jgi:hypothetical protein